MRSYHGRNTKLHYHMHKLLAQVMEMCGNESGEYTAFMRGKISNAILAHCYPDSFIRMLLQATLTDTGIETRHTRELGRWLLINIYSGDVRLMLADWLEVKRDAELGRGQHGTGTQE